MKKALIIIANSGFQDTEYAVPRKKLKDAGVEIHVAAGRKGPCIGKFGSSAEAEYTLGEVSGNDYDVVVFVGGPGAAQEYQNNEDYLRIAKEANIVGPICIAPTIVSDSGIFRGKRVTGWDSRGEQKKYIEDNGGIFTGEMVTVDGNIITGNGPDAAEAFGDALVQAIGEN